MIKNRKLHTRLVYLTDFINKNKERIDGEYNVILEDYHINKEEFLHYFYGHETEDTQIKNMNLYKSLILKAHPDKNTDNDTKDFIEIKEAYEKGDTLGLLEFAMKYGLEEEYLEVYRYESKMKIKNIEESLPYLMLVDPPRAKLILGQLVKLYAKNQTLKTEYAKLLDDRNSEL